MSRAIRVGLIGPQRTRQGTGPWVGRFFAERQAEIVALAASTDATARHAANVFCDELGIDVAAYSSVESLLDAHLLDVVAICSPMALHLRHLELVADRGLHAFCEKPLVFNEADYGARTIRGLVERFGAHYLYLNNQWNFTLREFEHLYGRTPIDHPFSFEMLLSPAAPGPHIWPECLPHAVGLLVSLGCTGEIEQGSVEELTPNNHEIPLEGGDLSEMGVRIRFVARHRSGIAVQSVITLRVCSKQPRPAWYAINGKRMEREICMEPYAIRFHSKQNRTVGFGDPLRRSVDYFLAQINGQEQPKTSLRYLEEVAQMMENLHRIADYTRLQRAPQASEAVTQRSGSAASFQKQA